MGQEASVPMDPDLEEQARAPPSYSSSTPPPPPPPLQQQQQQQPQAATVAGVSMSSLNLMNRSLLSSSSSSQAAPNTSSSSTATTSGSAKGFFQHHNQNQHHQHHHHQQQQNEFEARESARAAAMGGNLYLEEGGSGTSTGTTDGGGAASADAAVLMNGYASSSQPQHYHHHQQQKHPLSYVEQQDVLLVSQGGSGVSSSSSLLPPKSPTRGGGIAFGGGIPPASSSDSISTTAGGGASSSSSVGVGIMLEQQRTGSKRGLFANSAAGRVLAHSRGAALIHSMRNLNLGKALGGGGNNNKGNNNNNANSSRQQMDWEKQWDEDEDDDSEEDEDDADASVSTNSSYKSAAGGPASALHLMTIKKPMAIMMDTGHSGAPVPAVLPPSSSLLQEQLQQQQQQLHYLPPLEVQQLAAPSAITPSNSSLSNSSSLSPPRHPQQLQLQQQQQQRSHYQDQQLQQSPQPEDLLSRPLVVVGSSGAGDVDDRKPNVEMFLPMLRVLGKGSFGKVVLVQKRVGKERGQLFAMKILRKTHLVKRRQIERTRTERKVLSAVNHPFIMKLHYAFQSEEKLYLVLDYCPGGELFFHLSRCRRFPERVARFYAAELLLAIGHLHKRGIIYRDLKPENVLLDADGHVKLGDFGLAKAGITNPVEGATSMCGTPEYMAPEVLAQQGHGFCVDYWGLGMLTYEMMTGLPPWYTTDRQKLFRRLKSAPLEIPSFFSPPAADCVAALLERNPRRRLGVAGIRSAMEHEFFRNISWRSLYARRVEAPVKPCESWKAPDSSSMMNNGDADLLSSPASTVANLAEIEKIDSNELDAATTNFDATFLRMPVESEDNPVDDPEDVAAAQELRDDTFLGFTFDSKERDQAVPSSPNALQRLRTHHYQQKQP